MIASSAVGMLIVPTHPIIILGARAIVFVFVYIVGAILFGALTPEDQDAIYKQARRLSRKHTSAEIPKPAEIEDRVVSIEDYVIPCKAPIRQPVITPECKARAVIQVLEDAGSARRICNELQIDESQLAEWKERFTKYASSIFENWPVTASANERIAEHERQTVRLRLDVESEKIAELERLVGRLMLELEESKRESAIMGAPIQRNGKHDGNEWDL
jgi:transposase-like protein